MEKKNQNEELQSRREFFKKAAKGVLPILGAVVLAGTPLLSQAAKTTEASCYCGGTCFANCHGSCSSGCLYGCQGQCRGGCAYSCKGACQGSCEGSCRGTCQGGCTGGCYGLNY